MSDKNLELDLLAHRVLVVEELVSQGLVDQSQISAHFDGNLTVVTYITHQWLRNFPKTLDRCVSGQPWESSTKPSGVCVFGRCALRGSDRFTAAVSIRQRQVQLAMLEKWRERESGS